MTFQLFFHFLFNINYFSKYQTLIATLTYRVFVCWGFFCLFVCLFVCLFLMANFRVSIYFNGINLLLNFDLTKKIRIFLLYLNSVTSKVLQSLTSKFLELQVETFTMRIFYDIIRVKQYSFIV